MGLSRTATFGIAFGALLLLFAYPLRQLAGFALRSELYSHILLIPIISLYLAALRRRELRLARGGSKGWAVFWTLAAVAAAGLYVARRARHPESEVEGLALAALGFLSAFIALLLAVFGSGTLRPIAFPIGLLFGMVPLPPLLLDPFQSFLQHSSAAVASWFFPLTGIPAVRHGLVFQLPNIALEVAEECSGIHSTLVLIISCLIAGHLFLRDRWHRMWLVAAAIPLGILRNAFRIWVIAGLCWWVKPEMIDSPVHHRGGPVFFVLTLVPLGLLTWILRRQELPEKPVAVPAGRGP